MTHLNLKSPPIASLIIAYPLTSDCTIYKTLRSEKQLPLLSKALSELSNDLEKNEITSHLEMSQKYNFNDASPVDELCSPVHFALVGHKGNYCKISPLYCSLLFL